MTEEIRNSSGDKLKRPRLWVTALAAIYVATFASGFLQDTPWNPVNYVFFSALGLVGLGLLVGTLGSTQTVTTKGFLVVTGTSAVSLLAFYIGYEWFRLQGNQPLAASLEGLLYWLTLLFWIGAVGSLCLIRARS